MVNLIFKWKQLPLTLSPVLADCIGRSEWGGKILYCRFAMMQIVSRHETTTRAVWHCNTCACNGVLLCLIRMFFKCIILKQLCLFQSAVWSTSTENSLINKSYIVSGDVFLPREVWLHALFCTVVPLPSSFTVSSLFELDQPFITIFPWSYALVSLFVL